LNDLRHGDWLHSHNGPQQVIWVLPATLGNRHLYGINGGPKFFTEDHPLRDAFDPTILRVIDVQRTATLYPEKASQLQQLSVGNSLLFWNGTAYVPTLVTALDYVNGTSSTPLKYIISATESDTDTQTFGVNGWLAATEFIEYTYYPAPTYIGYLIVNFTKPTLPDRRAAYKAAGGTLRSTGWLVVNVEAFLAETQYYINTYLAPTPAATDAYNPKWISLARDALYWEFLSGPPQGQREIDLRNEFDKDVRAGLSDDALVSAFNLLIREKMVVATEPFGYYPFTDNDDTGFQTVSDYITYMQNWWASYTYVDRNLSSGRSIF